MAETSRFPISYWFAGSPSRLSSRCVIPDPYWLDKVDERVARALVRIGRRAPAGAVDQRH